MAHLRCMRRECSAHHILHRLQCGEAVREANFMVHEEGDDPPASSSASSTCDDSAFEVAMAAPLEPTQPRSLGASAWRAAARLLLRLCGGKQPSPMLDARCDVVDAAGMLPTGRPLVLGKHDKQPFVLPRLWATLKASADFDARRAAVAAFNAQSQWRFKGIAMVPWCGVA